MHIRNWELDYIRYEKFNWLACSRVKKNFGIVSTWTKKERRPQNSWIQQIIGMRARGLSNKESMDKKEWRRQNKTMRRKICEHYNTLYNYIIILFFRT